MEYSIYEEVPFSNGLCVFNYNFIGDEDADDRWLLLLLEVICLLHFFLHIAFIYTHNIGRSVECCNFAIYMWKIFLRFIDACVYISLMSSKYKSIISIASKALTAANWVLRLYIKFTHLRILGWIQTVLINSLLAWNWKYGGWIYHFDLFLFLSSHYLWQRR